MAKDAGWGRRLRSARRAYEERHDETLTYTDIGERLGRRLKRPAFKHSTVRAWFVDGQEPDSFEVTRALADVLNANVGALIGEHEKAPTVEAGGESEDDVEAGAVPLSTAAKARARESAATTRQERKKAAAKKPARRAAVNGRRGRPRKPEEPKG